MPIRIRLTLWYTFLLGAILVIFSILLYLVLMLSLHAQIDRNLQDRAQQTLYHLTGGAGLYHQRFPGADRVAEKAPVGPEPPR